MNTAERVRIAPVAPARETRQDARVGMNIGESLRVALGSLAANKLRSVLTMLGIIIGVAAVIALLSIGQGVQVSVREQIQGIGINLVTVFPGSQRAGGIALGTGSAQTLTYEDALAIASSGAVTKAAAVSPELNQGAQIVVGSANTQAQIVGAVPDYLTVHNAEVASGEFITSGQVAAATNVVVLGPRLAETLFGDVDPVGQRVTINRQSFQVIGVLVAKGGAGFGSPDDRAFVPLTTMQRKLSGTRRPGTTTTGRPVSSIAIQAVDEHSVDQLIVEVTEVLRERHRIGLGEDDFTIFNQADLLASASQITTFITAFLGAVAGISLLVGGIGIMNIMLVSVTERTREIGIRKAIGARRRDILGQFLIESVVLSLAGAVMGILLGVGIAMAANTWLQRTIVAPEAILLAVTVAVAIGVFFGIYPARRASRLNPIDALRYE
jgi:putative ABC transport system permease protein